MRQASVKPQGKRGEPHTAEFGRSGLQRRGDRPEAGTEMRGGWISGSQAG